MPKNSDPLAVFHTWYTDAIACKKIKDASAMNLATSTKSGHPSSRMVLLKGYDQNGFVFYTNLGSRKSDDLHANPYAALCFYWEALERQIRIEGTVQQVDNKEADEYFNTRPLQSRIGAWASKQSQPLQSHSRLLARVAKYTAKSTTQDIHRPDFWSGYNVCPTTIEFWQKGDFRLHRRTVYQKEGADWIKSLLYP